MPPCALFCMTSSFTSHTQTGGNVSQEVGDSGGDDKDGGGGILGLSQYLASVEEEDSSDDDWDD